MPSFISSSETPPRWALAFLIALLVAAAICGAQEYRWRQRGYRPNILDTAQLWSMQRARAYASAKTPLLLLGASRIEYGIDMKLLKQLLPRYQPVMLAQNGHYPLATLIDLGNDENFRGIVGFKIVIDEIQAAYKLSQNRDEKSYHNVVEELEKGDDVAKNVAEEMKKKTNFNE